MANQTIPQLPATQPHQHVINLKPDHPPPFSGKKGKSLDAWTFQMNQYCLLLPVPTHSHIPFTATFLKDNAALWWHAYSPQYNWYGPQDALPPWEDFVTALHLQFAPVNPITNAYGPLRHLVQRMSVTTYS